MATESNLESKFDVTPILAKEMSLSARSVASVSELLAGGATVPFIARYRKEATGGLDEVQIPNYRGAPCLFAGASRPTAIDSR